MQVIQFGERPNPAKRSEQPVLSLGAEAARLGLSVGRGAREPQCESVKRISPVRYDKVEADTVLWVAGSNAQSLSETVQVPPGSIERGERAKVVSAYLGGLTGSGKVFFSVRAIEVL